MLTEGQFSAHRNWITHQNLLREAKKKSSGQAMSNANSEAFIINKCLLSDSLTPCLQMGLLRAVPGPKLKADVGRTQPGDLEEMAGQDWSPPDSDGGWFDTGDSRNRQSICRRTAMGEEITGF